MGSLETSAATTSNLLITLKYSMPCTTCPKELPLSPPALLVMFTGANVHKVQFFGEDSEARLFVLLCICVIPCITGIARHSAWVLHYKWQIAFQRSTHNFSPIFQNVHWMYDFLQIHNQHPAGSERKEHLGIIQESSDSSPFPSLALNKYLQELSPSAESGEKQGDVASAQIREAAQANSKVKVSTLKSLQVIT